MRFHRSLALTAVTALLLAACSGTGASPAASVASAAASAPASQPASAAASPAASSAASAGASAGGALSVGIAQFKFAPESAKVAVGGQVEWANRDEAPHTVTFDDPSIKSSDSLATGDTFSTTFPTAGTFPYKCNIHPTMRGEVVVS